MRWRPPFGRTDNNYALKQKFSTFRKRSVENFFVCAVHLLEAKATPVNHSPGLVLPVWLFFKSVLEISEKPCEEIEKSFEKVLGFLAFCRFAADYRRERFIFKVKVVVMAAIV